MVPKNRTTLILASLLLSLNIALSIRFLLITNTKQGPHRTVFFGNRFLDAKRFLNEIPVAGYYTDHNPSSLAQQAQLVQARLTLAPTVLDDQGLDHHFLLIDCSTPPQALKKLNAQVIHMNSQGVIVAERRGVL